MVVRIARGALGRRRAVLVVVAAAVGAAFFALRQPERPRDPILQLWAHAPERRAAGRLSGFAWSRQQPRQASLRAQTAYYASLALQSHADTPTPASLHAAAVASYIRGDFSAAVARLQASAALVPDDARLFSDLAAAQEALATESARPGDLRLALAATAAALRIDAQLPEALFNRAVIIENLGLRPLAITAWQRYLAIDARGPWADEARAHLRALNASAPPDVRAVVRDARRRLTGGDPSAVEAFVASHAQDARMWAEGPVLVEWAESGGAAAEPLDFARAVGRMLAGRGEHGVEQSVGVIDDAAGARRARLIEAYSLYGRGRKAYAAGTLADAEQLLRSAARMFAGSGSPMAEVSRYFLACVVFDAGRLDEAGKLLRDVQRRTDAARLPALSGQVRWQLGLWHFARGRYGAAAVHFQEARALFDGLGEALNGAIMGELLAETNEMAGETSAAWRERPRILTELAANDLRLHSAIAHLVIGAMRERQWLAASALLELESEQARRTKNPRLIADAAIRQVTLHFRESNAHAARAGLGAARQAVQSMRADGRRQRAESDLAAIEALLSEGNAVALLTEAIDFHRREGRLMYVPALLLQRAQAWQRAGERERAADDVRDAVATLEMQHDGARSDEPADIDFDVADEAFTLAIQDRIGANDASAALQLEERARALATFKAQPAANVEDVQRELGPDTALLEYVVLQDSLVILVARAGGVRTIRMPLRQALLERQIAAFRRAMESGAADSELRRLAAALHDSCIGPAAAFINGVEELVIVPSGALGQIPFAALYDRRTERYLVESRSVTVVPSATAWLRARGAQPGRAAIDALVVANPQQPARALLPDAMAEAAAVAKVYRAPVVLSAEKATTSAFRKMATQSAVIHFAGHGMGESGVSAQALAFAQTADDDGVMDAQEFAHLPLRATRVAVLAACNSAMGQTGGRERTVSVARAFLAAGVPSVLGSLWRIRDRESVFLFTAFHAALARGQQPRRALREAQLACLRSPDPRLRNPGVWAAVEHFGG